MFAPTVNRGACAFAMVALCVAAIVGQEPLPRFRSGANLVTVDAYISKDDAVVTDLRQDEVEIIEDGQAQRLEAFRIVRSGARTTQGSASATPSVTGQTIEASSRTFVLFFDTWHVSLSGSLRAGAPVSELVNRVIGPNDKVGVLTPDIPSRTLDLTARAAAIDRLVRDTKDWGQRDTIGNLDPREREIDLCYPDNDPRRPQFRGIAKAMIERQREQKTLRALDELVQHLATLGDERKFVVLLTEGWVLFRQDESLARVLEPESIPSPPPVGSGSQGLNRPATYDRSFASCERERSLLAFVDHTIELRQLAQRANRANVTFYAIDPRGLAAFDDTIGPMRPATPSEDRSRMASRQGGLRELALNTDGAVVLNTDDVKGATARMMADLSAYYVMQYYSTNTKLDGRFRSIEVRVKRPGVRVRARPGYLAPTAEEARVSSSPAKPSLPTGAVAIKRRAPMTALRRGPATGLEYVRADAAQFRRTERLRVEMEMPAGAANVSGQVLTSQDQPLPLPVAYSTAEANGQSIGVFDVVLAPLAQASYVLRMSYEVDGKKEAADYVFRIVP